MLTSFAQRVCKHCAQAAREAAALRCVVTRAPVRTGEEAGRERDRLRC